ncbi:ABCB5 [Symbiodinium sp. CCMP2592]|nr:ABCB5 [Symbiodinium sp. CCMP2592]
MSTGSDRSCLTGFGDEASLAQIFQTFQVEARQSAMLTVDKGMELGGDVSSYFRAFCLCNHEPNGKSMEQLRRDDAELRGLFLRIGNVHDNEANFKAWQHRASCWSLGVTEVDFITRELSQEQVERLRHLTGISGFALVKENDPPKHLEVSGFISLLRRGGWLVECTAANRASVDKTNKMLQLRRLARNRRLGEGIMLMFNGSDANQAPVDWSRLPRSALVLHFTQEAILRLPATIARQEAELQRRQRQESERQRQKAERQRQEAERQRQEAKRQRQEAEQEAERQRQEAKRQRRRAEVAERFGDLIDGLGSTMFAEFDTTAFVNMSAADQASMMEAMSQQANELMLESVGDTAIKFILIGCGVCAAASLQGFSFAYFVDSQVKKMRPMYFDAMLHQDVGWFDTHSPGALAGEMTADLEAFHEAFGTKLGVSIMSSSGLITGLAVGFFLSWEIPLLMLATLPLMSAGAFIMGQAVLDAVQEVQGPYEKAAALADEMLFAIRTVVAFGGEAREIRRYSDAVSSASKGGLRNRIKMGFGMGYIWFVYFAAMALAFWFAMTLMTGGKEGLTSGRVMAAFTCVLTSGFMIGNIAPGFANIAAAKVSMARFFCLVNRESTIQKRVRDDREVIGPIETLQLEDVHFAYPARPEITVLHGLSLTIQKGKKVAVVGESGSGKSTIMALLERFYDPSEGKVLVNEKDLRTINIQSYRKQIGYVGQEPVLFATSVRENILQGSSGASEEDFEAAAKQAQLDFVRGLPKAFDTYVGSGGSQFSGGQKQRIAIARALLKKPSLLFLDEATSALDSRSEKMIQRTIDSLGQTTAGKMTIVSIAHRLSTVQNSDIIFVLSGGRVAEKGSHSELTAQEGGIYQALAAAQGAVLVHQDTGDLTVEEAEDAEVMVPKIMAEPSKAANTMAEEAEDKEANRIKDITKNYKVPMRRLLSFSRPQWWAFAPGFLGAVVSGACFPVLGAFILVEAMMALMQTDMDVMKRQAELSAMWFLLLGLWLYRCGGRCSSIPTLWLDPGLEVPAVLCMSLKLATLLVLSILLGDSPRASHSGESAPTVLRTGLAQEGVLAFAQSNERLRAYEDITQVKSTAQFCGQCGGAWSYSQQSSQRPWQGWDNTAWEQQPAPSWEPSAPTSPRQRADGWRGDGKGAGILQRPRGRSPRSRGKGKGQKGGKHGWEGKGDAKGKEAVASATLPQASQKQLLTDVPAAPTMPKPNMPGSSSQADSGGEKLPPQVMDLLLALQSKKEELPQEVRALLDTQEEADHKHAGRQLHRLVTQQTQARKELSEIRRARSSFVQEWSAYLVKLTELLQKQLVTKDAAMASMAESEEKWIQQLTTSTREIKKQSAVGLEKAEEISSGSEDMEVQETEVSISAALDAQRQAAIEKSRQQEGRLIEALKSASEAAVQQEDQYRERTPRRKRSDASHAAEAAVDAAMKGGTKPEEPPPHGTNYVSRWWGPILALCLEFEVRAHGLHLPCGEALFDLPDSRGDYPSVPTVESYAEDYDMYSDAVDPFFRIATGSLINAAYQAACTDYHTSCVPSSELTRSNGLCAQAQGACLAPLVWVEPTLPTTVAYFVAAPVPVDPPSVRGGGYAVPMAQAGVLSEADLADQGRQYTVFEFQRRLQLKRQHPTTRQIQASTRALSSGRKQPAVVHSPLVDLCLYGSLTTASNAFHFTVLAAGLPCLTEPAHRDWTVAGFFHAAVNSVPALPQSVQLLTHSIAGLPEPQFVLTTAGARAGAVPIDCRGIGGPVTVVQAPAGTDIGDLLQDVPELAELDCIQELLLQRDLFLQDSRGGIHVAIPDEAADLQWLRLVSRSGTGGVGQPALTSTSTTTTTTEMRGDGPTTVRLTATGAGMTLTTVPIPLPQFDLVEELTTLIAAMARAGRLPTDAHVLMAAAWPLPTGDRHFNVPILIYQPGEHQHVVFDPSFDGSQIHSMIVQEGTLPEQVLSHNQESLGYAAWVNGAPQSAVRRHLRTGDFVQMHPGNERVRYPVGHPAQLIGHVNRLRCLSAPLRVPAFNTLAIRAAHPGANAAARQVLLNGLDRALRARIEILGLPARTRQSVVLLEPARAPHMLWLDLLSCPTVEEAEPHIRALGIIPADARVLDSRIETLAAQVFVIATREIRGMTYTVPNPIYFGAHTLLHLPADVRPPFHLLPVYLTVVPPSEGWIDGAGLLVARPISRPVSPALRQRTENLPPPVASPLPLGGLLQLPPRSFPDRRRTRQKSHLRTFQLPFQ